jgi:hypothetical protein
MTGHGFFDLDGHHVCEDGQESFRKGYCSDCADILEQEGLCVHGSYPDGCGGCEDEAAHLAQQLDVTWIEVGASWRAES